MFAIKELESHYSQDSYGIAIIYKTRKKQRAIQES